MNTYDGKGSLDQAIANLELCSMKSNNTLTKLKNEALDALGIKMTSTLGGVANEPIRLKVYEWLRDNKSKYAVEPVPQLADTAQTTIVEPALYIDDATETINIVKPVVQDTDVETVEPVPQSKRKYADQYEYKTIAFNTINDATTTRHVIKLERYLIDAIKDAGAQSVPQFLGEKVAREWNETTGDKSITKMVKRAIVEALVAKIPK